MRFVDQNTFNSQNVPINSFSQDFGFLQNCKKNKVAMLVYMQHGSLQIGLWRFIYAVLPLVNSHFLSLLM